MTWTPPPIDGRLTTPEQAAAKRLLDRAVKLAPRLEKASGLFNAGRFRCSNGMDVQYRLFAPKTEPGTKYPLVIFFHGSGSTGEDNQKQVVRNNIWGTGLWVLPENQAKHPCYVLAPQLSDKLVSKSDDWKDVAAVMHKELIDSLLKDLPIDPDRVYVTGQSMGGGCTFRMITRYPGLFAAAMPLCNRERTADASVIARSGIAVWAFVGDRDSPELLVWMREMIESIAKAGGSAKLTVYPGVGHLCQHAAYGEPDLGDWLFSQKRSPGPTHPGGSEGCP